MAVIVFERVRQPSLLPVKIGNAHLKGHITILQQSHLIRVGVLPAVKVLVADCIAAGPPELVADGLARLLRANAMNVRPIRPNEPDALQQPPGTLVTEPKQRRIGIRTLQVPRLGGMEVVNLPHLAALQLKRPQAPPGASPMLLHPGAAGPFGIRAAPCVFLNGRLALGRVRVGPEAEATVAGNPAQMAFQIIWKAAERLFRPMGEVRKPHPLSRRNQHRPVSGWRVR